MMVREHKYNQKLIKKPRDKNITLIPLTIDSIFLITKYFPTKIEAWKSFRFNLINETCFSITAL